MNTNTLIGWIVIVVVIIASFYFVWVRPTTPIVLNDPVDSLPPTMLEGEVAGVQDLLFTPNPTIMNSPEVASVFTPVHETVRVTLKTSKGEIVMELYGKEAPLAVGNFVHLTKQGFYTGVTFHRVIPEFMIQVGDPLSKDPAMRARHGTSGPGYEFPNEDTGRKFVRGAIGMANAGRDTNGSQFFIVVGEAFPELDGGYTNFGTVVSGMDVADAIVGVERDPNDNPIEPIVLQEVVIAE